MKWKYVAVATGAICLTGIAVRLAMRTASPNVELTGVVTTDDVVLAPQVSGRLVKLLVREGDRVSRGQEIAEIEPSELEADRAFYTRTVDEIASQVDESAASLRLQELEHAAKVRQAAAALASAESDRTVAAAQLADAQTTLNAQDRLARAGAVPEQEREHALRAYEVAKARLESLDRQVDAQRAALDLAKTSAQQAVMRRASLAAIRHQQDAAEAQQRKAEVRVGYTKLTAPSDGIVDVRATHPGEFVGVGQAVLTLVDPDDYWVRADVEESLIDGLRIGDHVKVRLPSGDERDGTIFFRGVNAAFATQRDVSRTKRDIRTFEIRLRVDNRDRRLALGLTVAVLIPTSGLRP